MWCTGAMIRDVDAIILYSTDLDVIVPFYRALGLALDAQEDVGGEKHYACEMGLSHFAIFPAREGSIGTSSYRASGSTLIGFQVDKVDRLVETAQQHGAKVVEAPHEVPWGRRAVISDPEGRTLELNQPRNTGQFPSLPTGTI